MIILPTREKYILDNFIELSVQEKQVDITLFKKLSSIEQYYLADKYNWDDGDEILNLIIDSEKCDKGTASLIFWRAEPDFYLRYTNKTIASYEIKTFELLQKIVSKFNNNSFKQSRLKFDPTLKSHCIDWEKTYEGWGKMPSELKSPTKGFVPFYLSRIIQDIMMWRSRRRYLKREAKKLKRKEKNST